jgi:hypothetical protein
MAETIRRVEYFRATVVDQPGEAYRVLSALEGLGVDLLAFTAIPAGADRTQLTLFPADPAKMASEASKARMDLEGPHPALLLQGDDELGALVAVHEKLYRAGVNVFASNGVSDGAGKYGYVIYVKEEECERAAKALGL